MMVYVVWHDFNMQHVGVVNAINEVYRKYNLKLYKISGTSLVFGKVVDK